MRHLLIMCTLLFVGLCGCYQNAFATDKSFVPQKIRTGDTILSILRRHDFTPAEREQVLRSSEKIHFFILSTEMTYFVSNKKNKFVLRLHDQEQNIIFNIEKNPRGVFVSTLPAKYKTEVQLVTGKVRGSLVGTIFNHVRSNWIASRFMDAFILEHNLEKLPAGANFWFKVEKLYDGPHFIGYGELLEVSLEIRGEAIQKNFIRLARGGVFVNTEDLMSDKPFYAPVDYLRIASVFQKGRRHPITRRIQSHLGIDFEAPIGTPIFAPKKGIVARMGKNRAAGNYVVLRHPSGTETAYNHLNRLPKNLRIGKTIQMGQQIGEIGCTGYCTKAHLHFAIKKNGQMVNPAKYMKAFPSHYEKALQRKVALLQ